MHIKRTPLPSIQQIQRQLPLQPKEREFIRDMRLRAQMVLQRKLPELAIFVGPCSIHDSEAAIEYAIYLAELAEELKDEFFLVMRLFIEKPRTELGWKGLLYDPYLDGSNDIAEGIQRSRSLLLTMAKLKVPCACELLDPLIVGYFSDLISWGFVGARTSASPIHRQMASGMPFPVGFKNDLHGKIDVAIAASLTAQRPQSHVGLNEMGQICALQTGGNPWTHLVLRGSNEKPNFDPASVLSATQTLKRSGLPPHLLVDCAHGNSGKNHAKQKLAFESAFLQARQTNSPIFGLMLESHLFEGRQSLGKNPQNLSYGISITDPCISWEETETWLREAALSCRPMDVASVRS